MRHKRNRFALLIAATASLTMYTGRGALAAEGDSAGSGEATTPGLQEIVVTAQKRTQSINDVGMSITALTGDQLLDRGVGDVADLEKVVPGFSFAQAPNARPVYTLRGVGFYDTTLSASPTTSVYVDEVPLPFSVMTRGADLDVERVEVLKGPQGTLFGENSTGGAINFVAAKPTPTFEAGFDASASRFGKGDVSGYVSGPLSDTLDARLAVRTIQGGAWQYDYVRQGATTGASNVNEGRLLLDWHPVDALKVSLNINGYVDRSENQAPQLVRTVPQNPANASPALLNYPLPPQNDRAASWGPEDQYRRDDRFNQQALRIDYDLGGNNTVTSLTSAEKYIGDSLTDYDATTLQDLDLRTPGWISTVTQELRLSHTDPTLNWVIGGNYEYDRTFDQEILSTSQGSNNEILGYPVDVSQDQDHQSVHSYAGFGNVEVTVAPNVSLQTGARFTQTNRTFSGCTGDAGNGQAATAFNALITALSGKPPVVPVVPGGCATLNADLIPGLYNSRLDQNNVSWRGGVNWKPDGESLLYANVSRGYKAGSYPTEGAITDSAYYSVPQESLIAYEVGAKLPFFNNTMHFSPALFYYDYTNKQLRGVIVNQLFGITDALISVPKSEVDGAEIAFDWAPISGLQLSLGATYIQTRVLQYTGYNEDGVIANFSGARLPFAPALEAVADAQYTWKVWRGFSAFAGTSATHHSAANAGIGDSADLYLKHYTVLDLRAGVETPDSRWRFTLWGHNVTNEYYWTNATHTNDEFVKYAGMPADFGLTVSFRFK
jgi:outer membrane receptor protein involved in Fe transport